MAIKFKKLKKKFLFFMSTTRTFRKITFFMEQINQSSKLCCNGEQIRNDHTSSYVTLEKLFQFILDK